jgi:hypothetical protein
MLTDAQKLDVVRWAGYGIGGIYSYGSASTTLTTNSQNIIEQLDELDATQETALTTKYLEPLATLEAALLTVSDNLDTKIAGPWTANDRELAQRTQLFDKFRRDMVGFLGFEPGPSLGAGGYSLPIVRC